MTRLSTLIEEEKRLFRKEFFDEFGSTDDREPESFLEFLESSLRRIALATAKAGEIEDDETLLGEIAATYSNLNLDYGAHSAEHECLYQTALNKIAELQSAARREQQKRLGEFIG